MNPKPEVSHRGRLLPGQVSLAAVTVNGMGVVAYWGPGARRLFGLTHQQAAGLPAAAILPVSGVIDAVGDGIGSGAAYPTFTEPAGADELAGAAGPAHAAEPGDATGRGGTGPDGPTSGRFWGCGQDDGPDDVLWWACPLIGPGLQRLLVLAADGARLDRAVGGGQVAAGFAAHRALPGAASRAVLLRRLLAGLAPAEADDIVDQLLAHGYPVLHTADGRCVPVQPRLPGAALPPAGTKA